MRAASAALPWAGRYTAALPTHPRRRGMPPMLVKLLIILFLILIVYNLGAGLFYMMTDKGQTDRTVKALTWRIGLSVFLILLVILGILTGVIRPHDLGR
jgi:succinate dehydrogenase/fumarate reductase cytochrome b subunit